MSWGFGDDWIWQFRKVDDRIHIVRRNVRFTAAKGGPQEKAVDLAYTDSVLFSLPIVTTSPSGGNVVDLTPVFMSDLPQISQRAAGLLVLARTSRPGPAVKGFHGQRRAGSRGHLCLERHAGHRHGAPTAAARRSTSTTRSACCRRPAISRGWPTTASATSSRSSRTSRRRATTTASCATSIAGTCKRPIPRPSCRRRRSRSSSGSKRRFPFEYRKPIRDGILEWNKAFEKAGFVNAIEVRQQPDNDDWDPEDINYNTFRWITAGAGFAMGPSRVNPTTGQILDADIIFDADFLQFWKQEYENFTPESDRRHDRRAAGPEELPGAMQEARPRCTRTARCELHHGLARELAFGAAGAGRAARTNPAEREKLIMQGLKEVTMHEVGHTLGLRHNFKASTMLTLEEMNDPEKTKDTGLTGVGDGLRPGQHRAQGHDAGRLFLDHDRPLRHVGDRIRLQAAQRAAPRAKWPS